jgi:hypothetical protein|tara:strand:- start:3157 stop:5601 length:2445 start_codon:yes stop_codon:yes gene_type:complete
MERAVREAHRRGGVERATSSDRGASPSAARAVTPATFFAPLIARGGWRVVGHGARAQTYGAMTLVPPGHEKRLRGSNAPCMTPGEEWEDADDEETRRALKACGLLVAKNAALMDKPKAGRSKPARVGLRDYIAQNLKCMISAMVAMRVSATVYRHKRWTFECFREVYRKRMELRRRLENSRVSALGKESQRSLTTLLRAFDTMMEQMCDPRGNIRAAFYDGMVACPWDVDYEWQQNAAFHEDLYSVPYATNDDRDMTHSYEVPDLPEASHKRVFEGQDSMSQDSRASTGTDDAGVIGGKRKQADYADGVTVRRCRIKPSMDEIPSIVALEMAAEIDVVAAATAHFFATCDLCTDGPTFHEYLTLVTSAYDFAFATEMQLSLENTVIPQMREKQFPDDATFHYTLLAQCYSSSSQATQLLKLLSSDPNPLLHISLMQRIEGVFITSRDGPDDKADARFDRLMRDYAERVASAHHKRPCSVNGSHMQLHYPPPIRTWIETCKLSNSQLYSPAVPSFEALIELRSSSPNGWVEISREGTGYWTAVMTKCGIPAQAVNVRLDIKRYGPEDAREPPPPLPPSSRPFVGIHYDLPDVCSEFGNFGLLLNCMPRDEDLAIECLRNYTGSTIALVGEWVGSTAGSRFVRRLAKRFEFATTTVLPWIGDSAHELSIWKRRAEKLTKQKRRDDALSRRDVFPAVKKCQVAGCQSKSRTMFCCRLCRSAFVCSEHLHALHDEYDLAHATEHCVRLLPTLDRLRGYEVELAHGEGKKQMRSETIMAFNPFIAGVDCWMVDYRKSSNDVYEDVQISVPRIERVENWE